MKTQPRRAPIGAAWCILHSGASWCLQKGCVKFAPFLFSVVCVWAECRKHKPMEKPIKILQQEALQNLLSPQSLHLADAALQEFYNHLIKGGQVHFIQKDKLLHKFFTEAELKAFIEPQLTNSTQENQNTTVGQ